MDELEKKLEMVRLRRERNKAWIDASKSNHAETKKSTTPELQEEVVAQADETQQIQVEASSLDEESLPLVDTVFSSLKHLFFLSPIVKKRKADSKLFIMSESYIIAYKSKVMIDSKKHRSIKIS